MKSLIIETGSSKPALILAEKGSVLSSKIFPKPQALSSELLLTTAQFLEEQNLSLEALSFLALGVGPGSYTGIRIGATFCKTASYALNLPLVTFCSLEAFTPPHQGNYLVALDARSQGAYLAEGFADEQGYHLITPPSLTPLETVRELSYKNPQPLSPDANLLAAKLEGVAFIESSPNLEHLAALSYKRFLQKESLSWDKIPLLYLSSPQGANKGSA